MSSQSSTNSSRSGRRTRSRKNHTGTPSLLIDQKDKDIFECAWLGHQQTAQRLVKEAPELLCQRDESLLGEGNTPLHYASYEGQASFVEFLLQHDSVRKNVDCENDEGCTPLFLACQQNKYKTILILLENGADPLRKHKTSQLTPVDVTTDVKVIELFVDPEIYETFQKQWMCENLPKQNKDVGKVFRHPNLRPPSLTTSPNLKIEGGYAHISWEPPKMETHKLNVTAYTIQLVQIVDGDNDYSHEPPPKASQASRFRTRFNWPWFRSTEEKIQTVIDTAGQYRGKMTGIVVKAFTIIARKAVKFPFNCVVGCNYVARVAPCNAVGEGEFSPPSPVFTHVIRPKRPNPPIVKDLSIDNGQRTCTVTLSWEGSLSVKAMGGTAAEKWTLTESRLNEKSQIHYKADVRKYKGTELCGRIPNLAPEMCLYFDIAATNASGSSPRSKYCIVKTPAIGVSEDLHDQKADCLSDQVTTTQVKERAKSVTVVKLTDEDKKQLREDQS